MSNAIEIEAKVLLTESDYKKLINEFKYSPKYRQTNYYIDTEDGALGKNGIALRIRLKNNHYELTLKTPLSQGLLEKNQNISIEEFEAFKEGGEFPHGDIERFLTMLSFDPASLHILTSLTTERVDVKYEGGLLSLDKNTYSGHVDYEIEFEYNNIKGAEDILKSLLEKNEVPVAFNKVNKIGRALRAIGR